MGLLVRLRTFLPLPQLLLLPLLPFLLVPMLLLVLRLLTGP